MRIPTVKLSSGYRIPQLGLGTWQLGGEECMASVKAALELGYSHLDTAEAYDNHAEVGRGMAGFDRSETFLTS